MNEKKSRGRWTPKKGNKGKVESVGREDLQNKHPPVKGALWEAPSREVGEKPRVSKSRGLREGRLTPEERWRMSRTRKNLGNTQQNYQALISGE